MMTRLQGSLSLGSVALLLTTTAALADVSAPEVWDDWKAMMTGSGEVTLATGSESYANGVLTVTDLTYGSSEDGITTRGHMPQIVFSENADGSVNIAMSPEQTLDISGMIEDGGEIDIAIVFKLTDDVMLANGSPGSIAYTFAAERIVADIERMLFEGGATGSGSIILGNTTGAMHHGTAGDQTDIAYQFASERGDMKATLTREDLGETVSVSGGVTALQSAVTMRLPKGVDMDDSAALFAAGFAVDGSSQIGSSEFHFSLRSLDGTTDSTMRLGGISSSVAVTGDAFSYDLTMRDVDFDATMPDMPFPMAFSAGELGMALSMPLSPSPEPAPYAARVAVSEVAVSDGIWDMLDAGRVLPRDPATFTVDISGTATLTGNLVEMADDIEMMDAPPILPNSLTINSVDLAFGGASAHAAGAFTFDTNDLDTFDGLPRPEGQVTATISGVNGLMKKLGELGLVPPEQAMGITMMLGMFSVPSGDDQLTSTIEITPDGQIMANGMPLPM